MLRIAASGPIKWISQSPNTQAGQIPLVETGGDLKMGSVLLLCIALTFMLSGCLEGNRNYGRYQDQGNYSGIIDSSAWYVGAEMSQFTQPLGYPRGGDFSSDVKRVYVKTEAELVSTIEAQTEPLVVVIASDIALTKPVIVKLPLLIQTTSEFGFPNSSLQFLASSGELESGAVIIVDAPKRKIPNLNCDYMLDEAIEVQTFVKLQGKITNPNVVLKSNSHLVVHLEPSFDKVVNLSSRHPLSTIALVGDSKIDLAKSIGRFVMIDRSRADRLFDQHPSTQPAADLRFLYVRSSFASDWEESTTLTHFPEEYIMRTNHCMNSAMMQQLLRKYLAKFNVTSGQTVEEIGSNHRKNCEIAGWADEVRQRRSCAAGTTPKDAAKAEGGAL